MALTPLETYRIYSSIQLHFNSKKYDYTLRRKPVQSFSEDQFMKRRDRFQFQKLGKDFKNKQEFETFCACFFFEKGGKAWVGDASYEQSDLFREYKMYMSAVHHYLPKDLNEIVKTHGSLDQAFRAPPNKLPQIITDILGNRSGKRIITFTLVSRVSKLKELYDEKYSEAGMRTVYESMSLPIWKFKNFLTLNTVADLDEIKQCFNEARRQSI